MHRFFSAVALVALFVALTAVPAFAHGGQYKGPSDAGSSGGNGGGTVAPPTNPSGARGAGPGAGVSGSGGTGARTGARDGARTSRRGGVPVSGGSVVVIDFDTWDFWWENNKDRFLQLKSRLGSDRPTSGSLGFEVGRGTRNTAASSRRPDRFTIDSEVIPTLLALLAEEDDADILDSAVLALGRTADQELAAQVAEAATGLLDHPTLSVQSSATLALGVLGSDLSTQLLVDILSDASAGKRAVGGGSPHFLVRAFAAISLGLIGDPDGVDPLLSVIEGLGDSDFEIKVGAIVGLGLLGPEHPRAEDARRFLESTLLDRRLDARIKSYVPTSLGKLGQVESTPALLACFLDRDSDNVVRQSAAIGLGLVATMDHTDAVGALLDEVREGRDTQTRHFALIALGEIGARDTTPTEHAALHGELKEQLLREIAKKGKSQAHRSWAALAGAIYARGQRDAQPVLIERLRAAYEKESDTAFRGAFAVALGLLGDRDPETATRIHEDLRERGDENFRGYAGIALGFLEHTAAAPDLRRLVQDRTITPTLRLQAATALGLMSDTEAVDVLIDTLDTARTLGVSSAVAKALGLIGDATSIPRLEAVARDTSRQKITRAFACVALGIVGEKTDLPWNAAISAHNNYRAKVSSIEEVLDIL